MVVPGLWHGQLEGYSINGKRVERMTKGQSS